MFLCAGVRLNISATIHSSPDRDERYRVYRAQVAARKLAERKDAEEARRREAEEAGENDDDSDEDKDPGLLGASFGGDGGDDDVVSEGEEVDQVELEFDGDDRDDPGVGAFHFHHKDDLPEIAEDQRYREEEASRLDRLADDAAAEGGFGVLDMVGARLSAGVSLEPEAEAQYKLSELDIDFPTQWAAADYVDGREWWLRDEGSSGELEAYLKTRPFEAYPLMRGKYAPEASRSSLREVGVVKAIVRVLDEDPMSL